MKQKHFLLLSSAASLAVIVLTAGQALADAGFRPLINNKANLVTPDGRCVTANGSVNANGSLIRLEECYPSNTPRSQNQQWQYNPQTRSLQSRGGKCITARGSAPQSRTIELSDCKNSPNQQWVHQGERLSSDNVRGLGGLCLDAQPEIYDPPLRLRPCDRKNPNQQFYGQELVTAK